MRRYMASLRAYLEASGATLADFGHDERLGSTYFFDEMHFTDQGAAVFTDLLAGELATIVGR